MKRKSISFTKSNQKSNKWVMIGKSPGKNQLNNSLLVVGAEKTRHKYNPSKQKSCQNTPERCIQRLLKNRINKIQEAKDQKKKSADLNKNENESLETKQEVCKPVNHNTHKIMGLETQLDFALKTTSQFKTQNSRMKSEKNSIQQNYSELDCLRERLEEALRENQGLKTEFESFKKRIYKTLQNQKLFVEQMAQQILKDYQKKIRMLKLNNNIQFSQKTKKIQEEINESTSLQLEKQLQFEKTEKSMSVFRNKVIQNQNLLDIRTPLRRTGQPTRRSRLKTHSKQDRQQSFQKIFGAIQKMKQNVLGVELVNLQINSPLCKQLNNNNCNDDQILKPRISLQNSDINTLKAEPNQRDSKKLGILKLEGKFSSIKQLISPTSSTSQSKKIEWQNQFLTNPPINNKKKGTNYR